MTTVKDQYEAYPYPELDPVDEAKRLDPVRNLISALPEGHQFRTDPVNISALWAKIEQAAGPWGLVLYSTLLKG